MSLCLVASVRQHLTQGHQVCYTCPTLGAKNTERAIIVGGRVRRAIADAGINNSELARRTGLQRRTIVRIANGHNEPDNATLEKIARGTGKSLDYFAVDGGPVSSPRVVEAVHSLYVALLEDLRDEIAAHDKQPVTK
jgi:transcriptional regulator with XRE-family HTH domain